MANFVFDILSTVIHLALAGALAAPIEYNRLLILKLHFNPFFIHISCLIFIFHARVAPRP